MRGGRWRRCHIALRSVSCSPRVWQCVVGFVTWLGNWLGNIPVLWSSVWFSCSVSGYSGSLRACKQVRRWVWLQLWAASINQKCCSSPSCCYARNGYFRACDGMIFVSVFVNAGVQKVLVASTLMWAVGPFTWSVHSTLLLHIDSVFSNVGIMLKSGLVVCEILTELFSADISTAITSCFKDVNMQCIGGVKLILMWMAVLQVNTTQRAVEIKCFKNEKWSGGRPTCVMPFSDNEVSIRYWIAQRSVFLANTPPPRPFAVT
jgi:hypothetical protein